MTVDWLASIPITDFEKIINKDLVEHGKIDTS